MVAQNTSYAGRQIGTRGTNSVETEWARQSQQVASRRPIKQADPFDYAPSSQGGFMSAAEGSWNTTITFLGTHWNFARGADPTIDAELYI